MGIMDTRYPAYEVRKSADGTMKNFLRRLELDKKNGIVVRLDSKYGLFGAVDRIIKVQSYRCLEAGQCSKNGIKAENDLYVCVTDEKGKETVFRFTMDMHYKVRKKYLVKYEKRTK